MVSLQHTLMSYSRVHELLKGTVTYSTESRMFNDVLSYST